MLEGEAFSDSEQDANYAEAMERTKFAADRRIVLIGDSVECADQVPDKSLDFVFVDANHYYPHVKLDIEAWLPKLKPSGLMCGHDYDNKEYTFGADVKRAVDEIAKSLGKKVETGADYTWFIS